MNHIVNIKTMRMNERSEIAVHPEKAVAIGIGSRKFAYLCFGSQKCYVKIALDQKISPEHLLLSEELLQELHLPDDPIYEISVNNGAITIGPYIGLLISDEDRRLTNSRLNKLLVYVKDYAKLHGAIVVFALNKVDKVNRLIEGYCYNPVKKCWQNGIFPYPASVYRTIGLNPAWKNHFLSVIGDKLFNSRFFGKWEMYQWFSNEPAINPRIPYTVLYHSQNDVMEMLARFPKLYIKPVLGLRGRGISRISAENGLLTLEYRQKGVNHAVTFADPVEAEEYMGKHFRGRRFLIQQALDLLEYRGGLIDFRCVVQKNQSGHWVCRAIVGRTGPRDSIVSNISSGGTAFTVETMLRKALTASAEEIDDLKSKMAAFAIVVCEKLDEYGINCGTLGLDIGVDKEQRLWLIEINNRDPDPGIVLDIRDVELFYSLKNGPLFYAKYLAGFAEEL